MVKKVSVEELSAIAQAVAEEIEHQICDCKSDARLGQLTGDARGCIIRTIMKIMDGWQPRLKTAERLEVLDWVQSQYSICL